MIGFNKNWGLYDIVKCAMPVTYNKFWYFTAYFGLFFAIPVLNKFIFSIDENTSKKTLIILVILFSVMGVLDDPFRSHAGGSAIWLIALYMIGALARKIKLFENRKTPALILVWAACILSTWATVVFMHTIKFRNYLSPMLLLAAMITVILFSRINIKSKIVTFLTPLCFGVYLLQLNQVIWLEILKDAFVFIADKSLFTGILYTFLAALTIFVLGILVEFTRSKIAKLIKIPALSEKVVTLADKLITKCFVFLK
ncbi:MAG: hypothetical protein IKR46_01020 [Clostridia bacterium]|nr:hypothetical protein [Clostridia bacterium]